MASVKEPTGVEGRAFAELADFDGKRVLEIGCGDGRMSWLYAEQAREVLGVDCQRGSFQAVPARPPRAPVSRLLWPARRTPAPPKTALWRGVVLDSRGAASRCPSRPSGRRGVQRTKAPRFFEHEPPDPPSRGKGLEAVTTATNRCEAASAQLARSARASPDRWRARSAIAGPIELVVRRADSHGEVGPLRLRLRSQHTCSSHSHGSF
jgi:hypothetical protein